MDKYKKRFSGDKAIVINAAYDALEALGIAISRSNSSRGTLLVTFPAAPALGGRIAVSPEISNDGTVVEVFPLTDDEQQAEWIAALFAEMQSLMRRPGGEESR